MKFLISSSIAILMTLSSYAQGYSFTKVALVPATSVKSQGNSSTCWCFSTTSFIESELLRQGKGEYDLSEMYIVRQKLLNQLNDNYLRRGKGYTAQGSLPHTWINAFNQVGIVPEEVYHGINYDSPRHSHNEMMNYLIAVADASVKMGTRSPQYHEIIKTILDTYLGPLPDTFTYNGKTYTAKTFTESLGINTNDYVELTSFTHHPFYEAFAIEVPGNWEHARSYNLPLDELMTTMDYALTNGYSICWDGDTSEPGFSHKNGIAIFPDFSQLAPDDRAKIRTMKNELVNDKIYPEVVVTPEIRQAHYESFSTTSDHLMHITGIAKDTNGTTYYVTKNSWGPTSNHKGGYLNMSDSYVRAKTVSIMLHKDAIPALIRKKLNI